jgi:hypothetical protein
MGTSTGQQRSALKGTRERVLHGCCRGSSDAQRDTANNAWLQAPQRARLDKRFFCSNAPSSFDACTPDAACRLQAPSSGACPIGPSRLRRSASGSSCVRRRHGPCRGVVDTAAMRASAGAVNRRWARPRWDITRGLRRNGDRLLEEAAPTSAPVPLGLERAELRMPVAISGRRETTESDAPQRTRRTRRRGAAPPQRALARRRLGRRKPADGRTPRSGSARSAPRRPG